MKTNYQKYMKLKYKHHSPFYLKRWKLEETKINRNKQTIILKFIDITSKKHTRNKKLHIKINNKKVLHLLSIHPKMVNIRKKLHKKNMKIIKIKTKNLQHESKYDVVYIDIIIGDYTTNEITLILRN